MLDALLNESSESTADSVDLDDFLSELNTESESDDESRKKGEEEKKVLTEDEIKEMMISHGVETEELDEMESRMFQTIRTTERAGWERGEGLKSKYEILNEKLSGIQPGLVFVAAQSNVGKSGFLLEVAYSATEVDDVYSLYFSLDDGVRDIMPRIISSSKAIPINAVRLPVTYDEFPRILKAREEGYRELYSCVDKFMMYDQSRGKSIEYIEKAIEEHYNYIKETGSNRKLFVQIDNFHDLDSEEIDFRSDKNKYGYLAGKLKDISEKFQIPIWCTAELRKLNDDRRPTKDDIREAGKIVYEATLCLMCYNEVGLKGNEAEIYYRNPNKLNKYPIFEVHFDKNKMSDFKGRLYYEFFPEYGMYAECHEEDMEKYNNLVYQG